MKLLAQYPLVGLILLAIGGVLLIWRILLEPSDEWPRPQAPDTFPPLFDPFDGDDPALRVQMLQPEKPARSRDSNGRFAKESLTKSKKRASAKPRRNAQG